MDFVAKLLTQISCCSNDWERKNQYSKFVSNIDLANPYPV